MSNRCCLLLLLVLATLVLGRLSSLRPFQLRGIFQGDLVKPEPGELERNEALFIDVRDLLSVDRETCSFHDYQMPIDHFNNKTSLTFKTRYWINDTYYKPGGPVFCKS